MQNIIELASEVKSLMDELSDIGASRDRLQALNSRAVQIHKIREIIDEADTVRDLLNEENVHVRKKPSASKKLIKKCDQVIEGFKDDWEKTVRDKNLSSTFIDPAKEHVEKRVFIELRQDWHEFVNEMSPPITKAWLNSLPHTGPLGEAKENVSKYLEEFKDFNAEMPKDVDTIARVRKVSEAAKNIFDDLDDIPSTVRSFLVSASSTGAKIDDLTEDVRAWMTEHKMMDRLRVRLG
ncbi:hypothetical protein N9L49_01585 [Rhodospirillales bacterium]|nr:hypothetical protein [Rhodospirillales bacterium]